MKPTALELETYKKIGEFYLQKNNGNYEEARSEVQRLGIQEVIVFRDMVIFKLARPGLFIGKRGENIGKLETHLSKKIHVIEVNWVVDFIGPHPESEYPDFAQQIDDHYIDDHYDNNTQG